VRFSYNPKRKLTKKFTFLAIFKQAPDLGCNAPAPVEPDKFVWLVEIFTRVSQNLGWFIGVLLFLKDPLVVPSAGVESHSFGLRIAAPEAPYIRALNHAP
jgi:hypothetical protein